MPSSTTSAPTDRLSSLATLGGPARASLALTYLWLNASEVWRYFAFVMPMTRSAMPQIAGAAPMDLVVFAIWGIWCLILFVPVAMFAWLYFDRFGAGVRSALEIATLLWATIFGIFWLATWNMNMTSSRIPLVALPLAWAEMAIAAAILAWGWRAGRAARSVAGVEKP